MNPEPEVLPCFCAVSFLFCVKTMLLIKSISEIVTLMNDCLFIFTLRFIVQIPRRYKCSPVFLFLFFLHLPREFSPLLDHITRSRRPLGLNRNHCKQEND